MKAIIFETDATISPFGDPSNEARVLDQPVESLLREALLAAGAGTVKEAGPLDLPAGELLLAASDLWVTSDLAVRFVERARERGTPAILAIEAGLFTDFSAPVQALGRVEVGGSAHLTYPLVWRPAGSSWAPSGDLAEAAEGVEPLAIDLEVEPMEIPIHRVFAPEGKLLLPMTRFAAVRVGHWIHIVRANQLALMAWGSRLLKVDWPRVLWAAARAMSFNKWRVMQKLTVVGEGCDIHPSAVVEASTLGNNVKIGANAVVRYSHLADGVSVSDQCNIQYSVLGEGVSVARMGMLQSCVLYPGANSGHYGLQLCVVGRDTFVGGECVLGDFKPRGEVMVMHRGALVSSGTNMMGCIVGHDCQVLMRATTYPGREIPNGYWVLGPPHDVIAKIPATLPTGEPLVSDGGVLRPWAEVKKGGRS